MTFSDENRSLYTVYFHHSSLTRRDLGFSWNSRPRDSSQVFPGPGIPGEWQLFRVPLSFENLDELCRALVWDLFR